MVSRTGIIPIAHSQEHRRRWRGRCDAALLGVTPEPIRAIRRRDADRMKDYTDI
jgi:hypothetical protein